jgi:hypothetical protein
MFLTSDDGVGANSRGNLFVGFTGDELSLNTATYQSLGATLTQLYVKSGIMFPDVDGLGGFISTWGNLTIQSLPSGPGGAINIIGRSTTNAVNITTPTGDIRLSTTNGGKNINLSTDDNHFITISSGANISEGLVLTRPSSTAVVTIRPTGTSNNAVLNIDGNFSSNSAQRRGFSLRSQINESFISPRGTTTRDLYIGTDSEQWKSVQIETIQNGITPSEEPRYKVDAPIHYTHDTPIIQNANENIFSSGFYQQVSPGFWNTVIMAWQRCGNVVTCSGGATGLTGLTNLINYPIKGLGNVTFASGVWVKVGGGDQGTISNFSDGLSFSILPTSLFDITTQIRFTFSYVIN